MGNVATTATTATGNITAPANAQYVTDSHQDTTFNVVPHEPRK